MAFDMKKFEQDQFRICISNVEFALDPENGPLDGDALESVLDKLTELYRIKFNEEYVPDKED